MASTPATTSPPTRTVAAFDFDGTLTTRDTLVPYLRLVAGTRECLRAIAVAGPELVRGRTDDVARDRAKAMVLDTLLAGRRERPLRDIGERYARMLVARQLRPETRAALERHREAGHELVLVSASLTLYLDAVACELRIPHVLATAMEVDDTGVLTGRLACANVRADEKARRLDAWLAGAHALVHAYGDSRGDDALLARADHPTRVGRAR